MHIHTSNQHTLTPGDLYAAMHAAKALRPDMSGVYVDTVTAGRSRTHAARLTFKLASDGGPGRRRPRNTGTYGAEGAYDPEREVFAASWDDHGHWMTQVFERDPFAVFSYGGGTGAYVVYNGREHFHSATGYKYLPVPEGYRIEPRSDASADRPATFAAFRPGETRGVHLAGGLPTALGMAETFRAEAIADRLEYLRGQLRAECISYGELAELQGLADHIPAGDVELLEPAGVPEDQAHMTPAERAQASAKVAA